MPSPFEYINIYLFTCLFNDALSISHFFVLNDAFSVHNCKGYGPKLFWPILTDFPDIFLEELRKSTKNALEQPVSASRFHRNAMLRMAASVQDWFFRLTALVLDHHLKILRLLPCFPVHVFHLSYNQVR